MDYGDISMRTAEFTLKEFGLVPNDGFFGKLMRLQTLQKKTKHWSFRLLQKWWPTAERAAMLSELHELAQWQSRLPKKIKFRRYQPTQETK